MINFTREQELSIIEDYKKGLRWEELSIKYRCSSRPLYKVLKKYSIPKRVITNTETWSSEKLSLLKEMYEHNYTYKEMCETLNCLSSTLTYWIKKLGLKMRGSGRKTTFLNPFLDNTPERDYWLGYLFADGHIGQGKITLTTSNYKVAEAFNNFCNNNCHIYKRHYTTSTGEIKTMYWPTINSTRICDWFISKYHINSDKRYNLNPNIDLNWNILRGNFDGDGCAHKNGGFIICSGSEKWIRRISLFLIKHNIYNNIVQEKTCFRVCVWKKSELQKLVPLLYKDKTFYLEYKYKRLEPYISNNIMKTE